MRIMSFTKPWPKLTKPSFTTFRLQRRDKDYQLNERVKVVLHARTRHRMVMGSADIIGKEEVDLNQITEVEAMEDGFDNAEQMIEWLRLAHGSRLGQVPLHKLTLTYTILVGVTQKPITTDIGGLAWP